MLGVAIAAVVMLAGTACQRVDTQKDALLSAIANTARLARTVSYTETAAGVQTGVELTIADDFRYSATVSVGGESAASEVVVDDARALQVTNSSLLPGLVAAGASAAAVAPSPGTTQTATLNVVPAGLRVGSWVVDPQGGNSLSSAGGQLAPGMDPIYDSLTVLAYTASAVNQSAGIVKFNPESQDYRPQYDPFPRPPPGVVRYDVTTPVLAPRDPSNPFSLTMAAPGAPYFRQMSVYVQGGRVVAMREDIDVAAALRDQRTHLQARIADYGVNLNLSDSFDTQAAQVLARVNHLLAGAHQQPVRERHLVVEFSGFGVSNPIALPVGAVQGDLSGVGAHGQVLYEKP